MSKSVSLSQSPGVLPSPGAITKVRAFFFLLILIVWGLSVSFTMTEDAGSLGVRVVTCLNELPPILDLLVL